MKTNPGRLVRKASSLFGVAGCIDRPLANDWVSDWFELSGWAVARDDCNVIVVVRADGQPVCELSPSVSRPDVAARYPGLRTAETPGWTTLLKTEDLPVRDRLVLTLEVGKLTAKGRARPRKVDSVPILLRKTESVQRQNYGRIWDSVSSSPEAARIAVAGYESLGAFRESGQTTADSIALFTKLAPHESCLDVGCGTGRVALYMAPKCRAITVADVSKNMLDHARQTLSSLANVEARLLNGFDLTGIDDASIDVAYCTTVFMHLDEWDRYRYVKEMYRVLRPGGRAYFDGYSLLGDDGWRIFGELSTIESGHRPANISKSSTPDELRTYAERVGFQDIEVRLNETYVSVVGRKDG